MANVKKNTRESLVKKAVEMVKERGIDSLGIRSFAEYAGISTQPVYLNFGSFQGLKEAVISEINDLYEDFSKKEIKKASIRPTKRAASLTSISRGFTRNYSRFCLCVRERARQLKRRTNTSTKKRERFQTISDSKRKRREIFTFLCGLSSTEWQRRSLPTICR